MKGFKIVFSCLCFFQILVHGNAGKVLVLLPIATRSEHIMYYPLINELASRGHELTVVLSDTEAPSKIKHNVTTIIPFHYSEVVDQFSETSTEYGPLDFLFMDVTIFVPFCRKTYSNPDFKQKVLNQKFDVTIVNSFCNECFYGVVPKTNSKFILLSTFRFSNFFLDNLGLSYPVHSVPNPFMLSAPSMTFAERVVSFVASFAQIVSTRYYYNPILDNVSRQYLGEDTPTIQDLLLQTQLLLENTNYLTTGWRPSAPDLVQIGGLHCYSPIKPLPKDLEEFMNHPDGVIYISLGTVAKSMHMPTHIQKTLLAVFSKLKQRVIYKWEGDSSELKVPSNVKLLKWAPQQDILGHKNLRLYIAHGGMLSMTEAVYHGVPVLSLPVFFDQFVNTKAAVSLGHAEELDLKNIDVVQLERSVRQMLSTPKYAQRAKELSTVFKSGSPTPLEKAIYNIEFVINFKDVELPLSPARNLNFFQIHYFDIVVFLIGAPLICLFILYKIVCLIIGLFFTGDKSKKKLKTK